MTGERALPFRLAAGEGRCCHTDAGAALEALKARLARALWVASSFVGGCVAASSSLNWHWPHRRVAG